MHVAVVVWAAISSTAFAAPKKKKSKKPAPAAPADVEIDPTPTPAPAPATPSSSSDSPPPAVTGTADNPAPPNTGPNAPAGPWPAAVIDSGLAVPASRLALYGGLLIDRTSYTAPPVPPLTTGATVHDTALALLAGAGYGATEDITVGGEYELPIDDANGVFSNAGRLAAFVGYRALHDGKLDVEVGGDLDFFFNGGTTVVLHAGASVRYRLGPKLAVYTGTPLAPEPYGQQLVLGLNHSAPVALDIPIGFALQATPKVYAWAGTTLAHIKLANTDNAFLFADVIPLELGAVDRATKDLDVGAYVRFTNLESTEADFTIGLVARYYR